MLRQLPAPDDPNLLIGADTLDDAGVYRIGEGLALVQTVDFFPPVVDDPYRFGQIAAANALSDVFAKGGRPLTALNIVGFPKKLDPELLGEILRGGAEKVIEAGAVIVGGHSVVDSEVKYGLAVTGVIDPAQIVSNAGARVGDVLYLTKPLGMGTLSTAMKKKAVDPRLADAAADQMATLNRGASQAMLEVGVHAATDITGFGLVGHGRNLARASGVRLRFEAAALPIFEQAEHLAARGMLSGGACRGQEQLGRSVHVSDSVDPVRASLTYDAETSGGLLIAVPRERAGELEAALESHGVETRARVGEVVAAEGEIDVVLT